MSLLQVTLSSLSYFLGPTCSPESWDHRVATAAAGCIVKLENQQYSLAPQIYETAWVLYNVVDSKSRVGGIVCTCLLNALVIECD